MVFFVPAVEQWTKLDTLSRVLMGTWELAPTSLHVLCGFGEGVRPCPSRSSVGGGCFGSMGYHTYVLYGESDWVQMRIKAAGG